MNHRRTTILTTILFFLVTAVQSFALISVGPLTKEGAREKGIVMKSRPNGDAGVMVWLEFKKKGFLEKFTYAELQIADAKGNRQLSAMLRVNPVVHGQPEEIVSVSFSATPEQLANCSFLVVAYGSIEGDVGYTLKVSEFIDLKKEE